MPGILGGIVQDGSHLKEQLTFSELLGKACCLGTLGIHVDTAERHLFCQQVAKPASTQGWEWRHRRFNNPVSAAIFAWVPTGVFISSYPPLYIVEWSNRQDKTDGGPPSTTKAWGGPWLAFTLLAKIEPLIRILSAPNPYRTVTKSIPQVYQLHTTLLSTLHCGYTTLSSHMDCIHGTSQLFTACRLKRPSSRAPTIAGRRPT